MTCIPASPRPHRMPVRRSTSGFRLQKFTRMAEQHWTVVIATRHVACSLDKLVFSIIQEGDHVRLPIFALKSDRLEHLKLDIPFQIDRQLKVRIGNDTINVFNLYFN